MIFLASMELCVDALHALYSSKRLQLNSAKSEIIWFGIRASLKHIQSADLSLHVGATSITPFDVVRDL